jgi:hypothetical protein
MRGSLDDAFIRHYKGPNACIIQCRERPCRKRKPDSFSDLKTLRPKYRPRGLTGYVDYQCEHVARGRRVNGAQLSPWICVHMRPVELRERRQRDLAPGRFGDWSQIVEFDRDLADTYELRGRGLDCGPGSVQPRDGVAGGGAAIARKVLVVECVEALVRPFAARTHFALAGKWVVAAIWEVSASRSLVMRERAPAQGGGRLPILYDG